MELIPYPVGPLNPKAQDLLVALSLFAAVFLFFLRVLPRIQRALEARDEAIRGGIEHAEGVRARAEEKRAEAEAVLAEARHSAARIRQQAYEEGTAVIAATRTEGHRERDAVLAEGHARTESERATAEAELRMQISELASDLASRIMGERIAAPVEPRPGRAP